MLDAGKTNNRIFDDSDSNSEQKRKMTPEEILLKNLVTYSGAGQLAEKTKNAIKLLVGREKLTSIPIGNINFLDRRDVLQLKSYSRKKKSEPLTERGDILNSSIDANKNGSHNESEPLTERGDKFVHLDDAKVFSDVIFAEIIGKILTPSQAAARLDCSTRLVTEQINQKTLKATNVGGYWLILEADLKPFVDVIEKRRLEEQIYQEKLVAHQQHVERFKQLLLTDKLLENLFSPHSGQRQKDLIKQSFASFLRGSYWDHQQRRIPESEGLEVAKLARAADLLGISNLLPADVDLSQLANTMQRRITLLRDGTYLKQYAERAKEYPDLISTIEIAISRVNDYQKLLDKIRGLEFDNFLNN